jgi:hypothetical protein
MRRFPKQFIYPVILVMVIDFIFTLIGQPASYWTNSSSVNEGSPLGVGLLTINPIYFLIFCIIYLLIIIFLIRKLPLFFGGILALSLFLGHSYGSGSWVYTLLHRLGFDLGNFSQWYFTIGYFIVISIISVLMVRKTFKTPQKDSSRASLFC